MLNEDAHQSGGHGSEVGTVRARNAALLDALAQLREGHHSDDAWRTVAQHVRRILPTDRDEDQRQEALVTIFGSVHTLRATNDRGAAAWLRAVCRNRLIDRHRARGGRTFASIDVGDRTIQIDARTDLPAELAHSVVAAFAGLIDEHLTRVESRAAVRARRRTQALAALHRTALEEPLPTIAVRLRLTVSLTLLTKWVERGRAVIIDTVEAERERDPDLADFYAPFAELARERRADAGRPRPSRRTRAS